VKTKWPVTLRRNGRSRSSEMTGHVGPKYADDLILLDGHHRGTFLPSVWGSIPDTRNFLSHLKQKAGLPANYWSSTLEVYRYETESFSGAPS
ncbi:MAG: AMMECR1 domain-containing protein, partial [Candidatus Thiodiazotropha endolucinida]|nr:AMMECR1 domain-containing protein [Candidatus Thiodiazotropha taylori]MCW4267962.1 AMMECR1 domain-containing protein [Candidatus Thiodiazotropha endolucinida]